jgi:lipase chaperone LimK
MDPFVLAFGTALVGAMATSAWQQVHDAVTGIWRRVRPHEVEEVGAELNELREHTLQARRVGDSATETALEGAWQVRLQQLVRAEPALAPELQRVLEEVLTPSLTLAERARIGSIVMMGSSHDSSTFNQIGIQTHYNRQ